MRASTGGPPHSEEGAPQDALSDLAAAAKPHAPSLSIVEPSSSRGASDTRHAERVARTVALLGMTEAEAEQWVADTDAEVAEAERLDDEAEAREAAFVAEQADIAARVVERPERTAEECKAEQARIVEEYRSSGIDLGPAESLAEVVAEYLADCKAREAEVDAEFLDVLAASWSPEALAAEQAHRLARVEQHLDEARGGGPLAPEWLDRFRFLCTMAGVHLDEVKRKHLDIADDDYRLGVFVQSLLAGDEGEVTAERNAPVDWATLWEQADAPVEWLAEPLIEAGTSVALYSPPKVGKSLLALDVCAAIATGRSTLGKPAQAPRRVLYLDAENTPRDLVERLTAMGYSPADLDDRFAYVSFPSLEPLDTEKGGREFVALLDKHRPDLVVIDTVSRFVEGDENDARTYADLYRLSLLKAKKRGIAVLRLDHAGKDVAKGQRGSSAKSADVDTVWRLELVSERDPAVRLTRDVTRNGHGEGKVLLARITSPLRHVPTGKSVLASDDDVVLEEMAPNVRRLVEALQKHAVPLDYGRLKAGRALTERGVKWGNDDLSVALKTRSSLADPMGSDLSTDLSAPFGQVQS